jgi:hypothetical protein
VDPRPDSSEGIAKFLAGLIAVVLCTLGAMAVWTGEHVGRTRQGKEVFTQGSGAELFGWLLITLGLLPAALILRHRQARLRWALFAVLIGIAGSTYTLLR